MCSSPVGERTLARVGGSVTRAVVVVVVRRKEARTAIESEVAGMMMRQSSGMAKRNIPAKWGNGSPGEGKNDCHPPPPHFFFFPLFFWGFAHVHRFFLFGCLRFFLW